jgi:hypothetical protein
VRVDRRHHGIVRPVQDLDLARNLGQREVPGLGHEPRVGQHAAQAAAVAGAQRLQQPGLQHLGGEPLALERRPLAREGEIQEPAVETGRERHLHDLVQELAGTAAAPAEQREDERCPARGLQHLRPGDPAREQHPLDARAQRRRHGQRVGGAGRDANHHALGDAELHQRLADIGSPAP